MPQGAAPQRAAVVTGDLIGSTGAEPAAVDRAMAALSDAAAAISRWPDGQDTRFTRYRGDGWQIHIAEPGLALRAAIVLTAGLRATGPGLATRAAIGIGAVETLGGASLADAGGEAFEASGKALDAMGRTRRLAIAGFGVTVFHRIIVRLIDERSGRWTPEQAEAVALALHPGAPTLSAIAERLGITSQAVSYRLSGAGAQALRAALRDWETEYRMPGRTGGSI